MITHIHGRSIHPVGSSTGLGAWHASSAALRDRAGKRETEWGQLISVSAVTPTPIRRTS